MQDQPSHPSAEPKAKEGYESPRQAMRGSPKPFLLAVGIVLVAGMAAMVLWLSWDGGSREPGQMNATETGPSRALPGAEGGS